MDTQNRPSIINLEHDCLFFTKFTSLKLGSDSNINPYEEITICGKKSQVRHLAITLPAFENLLKDRREVGIIQLLRNFPNLKEIVLVLGDKFSSDDVIKGDLEVIEIKKEILKRGVLMALCMEVFQPWRAFDHLWGVEMVECAMGRWIEDIARRNRGFGLEWKPPSVKIREVRPCSSIQSLKEGRNGP